MALTKEALERAEQEATAAAVKQVERALQQLADALPVLCVIVRPTEKPVWVLELNPPDELAKRILAYSTEGKKKKVRRGGK